MRRKVSPTDSTSYSNIDDEINNLDDAIHAMLNPGAKVSRPTRIVNPIPAPVALTQRPAPTVAFQGGADSQVPVFVSPQISVKPLPITDDELVDSESAIKALEAILAKQKNDQEIKKLSENEKAVAVNIQKIFTELAGQIEEFKQRFQQATEKLWSEEDRNALLEEKVEALEEEKITLIEANHRAREDAKNGKIFYPVATNSNANNMSKDQRGDEIRRALLFDDYEENGVLTLDDLYGNGPGGFASAVWKSLVIRLTPFKGDIRKITAQFGSSVASFFIFYRFIFLQSILIALVALGFTIFHIISMANRPSTVQEILLSKGLLPQFMMYSSFDDSEQVYYISVVIGCLVVTFFALADKYIREDLISKEAEAIAAENTYTYGSDCFCAWDFSVASKTEADDYCGSLAQVYCLLLSETKDMGLKDSRSSADLFGLYVRRVIGFTLYLAVQTISFVLIILVTLNQNSFIKLISGVGGLTNLGAIVPPALLTTINYLTPELFTRITQIEQWDNVSTEINMLLFRMYCSNTLNLLLLAFSYALLANPFLLGDQPYFREALAVKPSSSFTCRMDQAANGLFTLVVFSFIIKGMAMIASPMMRIAKGRLTLKPFVKEEFAIAQRIVETLNLISVVFLSFPYAPLSLVFLPFFLYITLKWEKYTTLRFQSKPKRPWKAQKAGTVFTMFYLISLFLIGIPSVIFFLATKTFPKNCDIQDDYVDLCAYHPYSGNVCTTDIYSPYYDSYGDPSVFRYPASICEKSCGPFVGVSGPNIIPFIEAIYTNSVLGGFYSALFYYPYLPWGLTIALFLILSLRNNSVDVIAYHSWSKERGLNTRILKLELEQKRQTKIIGRMRSIERAEEEVQNGHHSFQNLSDLNMRSAAPSLKAKPKTLNMKP